jgi:hypothetical protein
MSFLFFVLNQAAAAAVDEPGRIVFSVPFNRFTFYDIAVATGGFYFCFCFFTAMHLLIDFELSRLDDTRTRTFDDLGFKQVSDCDTLIRWLL